MHLVVGEAAPSRNKDIANALGHVALLYFIGETIDSGNREAAPSRNKDIANALGHVALLYFIGETIDSGNHEAWCRRM